MERSIKDIWKIIVSTGEWDKMKRNEFALQTPFITIRLYRTPMLLEVSGSVITDKGMVSFEFISLLRDEIFDTDNWTLSKSELSLEDLERELAIAMQKSGLSVSTIKVPKNFYLANIELKTYDEPGWKSYQNIVMANSTKEAIAMLSFYYFRYNDIEIIPFLLPTGLKGDLCGI